MIRANRSDNMEININHIAEPNEISCSTSSKNTMNAIIMERIHDSIQDISRQPENVTLDSINVKSCKEGIKIILDSYINLINFYY